MIDLRSDTVTAPTDPMRAAMAAAPVGDDVYGEDPSVRALEERVADLLGHEAALFCASGSLANLLAVRAVTPVGTDVLCDAEAHVVRGELGSHAALFGVTSRTWSHPRGHAEPDLIEPLIGADTGPYLVATSTISVENTHNVRGGTVQPAAALAGVRDLADRHGLAVHVDGARIWNAAEASGRSPAELAAYADVVAVCLSKGLGAPVGSLLAGSAEVVAGARVWRKRLGAGWRQAGILAAAGSYALDHHLERLADDHARARTLAGVGGVDPATVDTNIVVWTLDDAAGVAARAREQGVLVSAMGRRTLRAVTHLGIDDADVARAYEVLGPLVTRRAA